MRQEDIIEQMGFNEIWNREDKTQFKERDLGVIREDCIKMFLRGFTCSKDYEFKDLYNEISHIYCYEMIINRYPKIFKAILKVMFEEGKEKNPLIKSGI